MTDPSQKRINKVISGIIPKKEKLVRAARAYCMIYLLLYLQSYVFAHYLPVVFSHNKYYGVYYYAMTYASVLAIPSALIWVNSLYQKLRTKILPMMGAAILTITMAGWAVFFLFFSAFLPVWMDRTLLYEKKGNPGVQVIEQIQGWMVSYGPTRIVKSVSILHFWRYVESVDINDLDDSWIEKNSAVIGGGYYPEPPFKEPNPSSL